MIYWRIMLLKMIDAMWLLSTQHDLAVESSVQDDESIYMSHHEE